MIYRLVEADEVVARLDNDFNVVTGDYISRIPQWIYQCLSDLNIYLSLVPTAYIADVENYYANTPTNLHTLIGVEYKGCRLDRRATSQFRGTGITSTTPDTAIVKTNVGTTITGEVSNIEVDENLTTITVDQLDSIRVRDASTITELPASNDNYMVIPNGKLEFSFESGIVILHYYKFPSSYNERLNSLCPLIPDVEAVKDAVTWYILKSILQRGGKHPVYKIGNPNYRLDPDYKYTKSRVPARNRAARGDRDQNKITDDMWNSHLYNVISKYR